MTHISKSVQKYCVACVGSSLHNETGGKLAPSDVCHSYMENSASVMGALAVISAHRTNGMDEGSARGLQMIFGTALFIISIIIIIK